MEKYLFKYANKIIISSSGYKYFLPQNYNYIIAHNSPEISQNQININRHRTRKYNDKIRISCIGLIRFNEQNKKIIHKFANDERFTLNFFGKNAMSLQEFCEKNHYKHVNIIDQFPPEKTLEYYKETDIINNLYGNNSMLLDYALSNKLYYAAKLGLPILVCPNTYMEKVSVTKGFGFCFDINSPNVCDDLYNYYININWNEFYKVCDAFNKEIDEENNVFKNSLIDFYENI